MKNYSRKLKLWESSALIALCLSLMAGTWAQARQNAISSELIRLHVIAASDSSEEQKIKLAVRDKVLEYLGPVLKNAESPEEAEKIIRSSFSDIALAAASAAEGRKVSVSLSREPYPTKDYRGFSLPAGSYDSLRIILDEGKGKNWWCIVFPPLCLEAAQAEQVQSVMSLEDYRMVSGEKNCRIRFKIVEIWGELTNMLSKS